MFLVELTQTAAVTAPRAYYKKITCKDKDRRIVREVALGGEINETKICRLKIRG